MDIETALAELTEHGDTVEHDGVTYRLGVEPDMDYTINDFDCYGRTERYSHDWRDWRDTSRPDDMDGNAEKIDFYDGWIWWQPPSAECGTQRGEPGFDALRNTVREILRWGFESLILEQLDGDTDAYGCGVVRNYASISGVEPMASGEYLAELIAELAQELEDEEVAA